jgi:photosystem II stability/assembly factor-like uncharacterized protein
MSNYKGFGNSSNGQFWNGHYGFLYKKSMGGGSRRNPSLGLICNQPTYIFNKYNPGNSGVGASNISNRRAKNRKASVCNKDSKCGSFYMYLGMYNKSYNPNGFFYYPLITNNTWHNVLPNDIRSYFWERVAQSSDGKFQTAVVRGGNIYTSDDYGNTWKACSQNFNLFWYSISISLLGNYQSACAQEDHIYTSTDYGQTWTQNTNAPIAFWNEISISADGQYQTAVANGFVVDPYNNGYIYSSSDYGQTWIQRTNENNVWISISISNSGQYQTAISFYVYGISDPNDVQGYAFNSNDYGNTWTKNTNLAKGFYTCVNISSNGQIQVIGENNCNYLPAIPLGLYISYDYGSTFNLAQTPFNNWLSISMTHDGNTIIAANYQQTDEYGNIVANTGNIVISYNRGETWSDTNAPLNTWTCISLPKNNNNITATATAWGSGVYRWDK